jgi:glycosyltransferase involved in cell wall biosynthesis
VRILILNWRCPRNPKAGGAELVTHEIARRLVSLGDSVEWFSSSYPGALKSENIDGVHVVRGGRQWTVHWRAFWRYRRRLVGHFDVVIDEVNTIPFLTPLWAGIPRFMFIHQLAREVWWYESRFPLSAFGYLSEPLYLLAYRRMPVLTVSASTASDLRRLRFTGPVTIVPEGLEPLTKPSLAKQVIPTFVYVGRLAPSKRVSDILRAFASFRSSVGAAQMWLVGEGPGSYVRRLQLLAKSLGVGPDVRFWGRLPRDEKHARMAEAHVLLMTSVREGWGLVVTEANACGTPAIVYDVPGLRDAVRHQSTGLVVKPIPAEMAAAMIQLWDDRAMYERLATEASRWSATFSFDVSATTVYRALRSLPES